MVALQIRNVPDHVHRALADRAAATGQSLQGLLLSLVSAEARRAGNAVLLQQFSGRDDGSHLDGEQVERSLDDERRQREADAVRPDLG